MPDQEEPGSGEHEEQHLRVIGERLPPPRGVRDRRIVVAALATAVGALMFGLGLVLGAPRTVYGGGLALALLALGAGTYWYFSNVYPVIEALEPRPAAEDEPPPSDEVAEPARRSLVGWLLAGSAGLLGLSFLAPVTSLGPAVGDSLRQTRWRSGTRLMTTAGRPLHPGDVVAGSLVTAWPEDAIEHERSAVVVVRLGPRGPLEPTNIDWVVDGTLVAYSKICTHAGCPVGLFREDDDALFCPCHLATFDAGRGARPMFGSAPRALPQLPLGVNEDDELVALGDFVDPIGPGYGWMQEVREDRQS